MTFEWELLAILNQIPAVLEKAFVTAFVERHPGHGNQKTHGNRYGAGQAKESLRRLKEDKGAREQYKARARQKSGLPAKPARESGSKIDPNKPFASTITVKTPKGDFTEINAPYKKEFVEDIKTIPSHARSFDPYTKTWSIAASHKEQAEKIISQHYNLKKAKSFEEFSKNTVKQLAERKLPEAQSHLRQNKEKISSRIADLDRDISKYSYGSSSNVKYQKARERALLQNVQRLLDKDISSLTDIERRSILAVYRDL